MKTLINDGSLVVRETLEGVVLLSPGTAILDDAGLRETATGGAAAAVIWMKALADGELAEQPIRVRTAVESG